MATCNIDAKGKAVRLIWGLGCLVVAVALTILLFLDILAGWGWWIAVGASVGFGALGIWEGRRGWCVVRAMGIRTPM